MSEFAPLAQRVGSADRARLDEHLTGLREVERVPHRRASGHVIGDVARNPPIPLQEKTMDVTLRAKLFLRLIAVAFPLRF